MIIKDDQTKRLYNFLIIIVFIHTNNLHNELAFILVILYSFNLFFRTYNLLILFKKIYLIKKLFTKKYLTFEITNFKSSLSLTSLSENVKLFKVFEFCISHDVLDYLKDF